jgi:hypothetical protein
MQAKSLNNLTELTTRGFTSVACSLAGVPFETGELSVCIDPLFRYTRSTIRNYPCFEAPLTAFEYRPRVDDARCLRRHAILRGARGHARRVVRAQRGYLERWMPGVNLRAAHWRAAELQRRQPSGSHVQGRLRRRRSAQAVRSRPLDGCGGLRSDLPQEGRGPPADRHRPAGPSVGA